MRLLAGICLLLVSLHSWASNKEALINAWEALQKSHPEVETFEKISDQRYKIKFTTLPFEGELDVLAYDVENIDFIGMQESNFTHSGYVEVDLVGAPDSLISKYSRTYYRWAQDNTLYYNQKTGNWVTSKTYNEEVQAILQKETGGLLFWLSEYSGYILLALFIYIAYTLVFGNKHLKTSIAQQKQAMEDMEETKAHMKEALDLHHETNRLLGEILQLLKSRE